MIEILQDLIYQNFSKYGSLPQGSRDLLGRVQDLLRRALLESQSPLVLRALGLSGPSG